MSGQTRRDFLKSAAAAAAIIGTGPTYGQNNRGDEKMAQESKEHVGPFSVPVPFLFGHTGLNFSLANDEKTLREILDWYVQQKIVNPDGGPPAVLEFFMGFGEGAVDLNENDAKNIARFKHIGPILEEYNVVGSALLYPHGGSGADPISTDPARRKVGTDYIKLGSKTAYEAFQCLQSIGPFAAEAVREAKRTDRPYKLTNAVPHLREAAEYVRKLNSKYVIAFEPLRWQESVVSTVEQGTQLIRGVKHPNLKYHADSAHGGEEEKYSGEDGLIQYAKDVAPIAATFHISARAPVTEEQLQAGGPYDVRNRAALRPDGQVGSQLEGIMREIIAANTAGLRVTCEAPIAAMREALLRGEPLPGFDEYASPVTHHREAYATAGQCHLMVSLAVDKATK